MAADFVSLNKLLKTIDVAEMLNCTDSYVRHLVRRQMISYIKFGKHVRFRRESVEAFLKSKETPIFEQPKRPSPLDMAMGRF